MPNLLIRAAALAVIALPLAGCLSYSEAPKQPAPVVVTPPPPSSGTVVVQPKPSYY
jgi:hypothetical protein